MSTFGLDKNYQQFNFEEISVDELQIISGGSGGGGLDMDAYYRAAGAGIAGALSGAAAGALRGAAIGAFTGPGIIGMVIGGAVMGAAIGFTGSALASTYG